MLTVWYRADLAAAWRCVCVCVCVWADVVEARHRRRHVLRS